MHCGLVHCRLKHFFLRISFSDLKGDVSSCVGRLKRVLFACSEKGPSSVSSVAARKNCQTLCLGACPRYSLVVDEDVKKSNKQIREGWV